MTHEVWRRLQRDDAAMIRQTDVPPATGDRAHDSGPDAQRNVSRRDFVAQAGAFGALLAASPLAFAAVDPGAAASPSKPRDAGMTVVCIIRYEIDPFQRDAFAQYARTWGRVIPRCGGNLIGYFLPWQGTNYVGWGLIAFDSLAAYEKYQARLRTDPDGVANFKFAQAGRFILREERNFVEVVEGTLDIRASVA